MLPKTAILDGDECVNEMRWQFAVLDRLAVERTTPGNNVALTIEQPRAGLTTVGPKHMLGWDFGQIGEEIDVKAKQHNGQRADRARQHNQYRAPAAIALVVGLADLIGSKHSSRSCSHHLNRRGECADG